MATIKVDPKANEELKEIEQTAKEISDAFEKSLEFTSQLKGVFSEASKSMSDFGETVNKSLLTSAQWKEVEEALDDTTTASKTSKTWMTKLGDALKSDVAKGAMVAAGALDGLRQGLRNSVALTKGVTGLFGSMVGGAFSVAKSIVAIPFRIMDGLFKMASAGGGGVELAQAYESVRETFGNLNSAASSTVTTIGKGMAGVQGATITGGLIWGNLAKQIEAANAMASSMGPAFNTAQKEMEKNGAAIMYYNKGLGITDDQMTTIQTQAYRMGTSISDVQNSMTKQSVGLAKALGINAKMLSKDMVKAMESFGHLSVKELAVTTAYMNKLGLSVQKLTGLMDSTMTFENTAESMSKLNEVFGTNIDIQKMALEQDPTKKLQMLRDEFAKTGKTFENMNVWERKLIVQNSGLEESTLASALSAKNMGVSFDKVAKQGEKNEKKVMTQAEAMTELSDSIKRIIEPLNKAGGIIDRIISGFSRGIQTSPEFLAIMQNINRVFADAFNFGMKLAKVFMTLAPVVVGAFRSISSVFDPKIFQDFFGATLKSLDVFREKGLDGIGDFADMFFKNVQKFFAATGPGVSKFLAAVVKVGHGFMGVMERIARWGFNKFADTLVGWLNKPKIPGIKEGTVMKALRPFIDGFANIGHAAVDALIKVVPTLTEKLPGIFRSVESAIKAMISGNKLDGTVPEWAQKFVDLFTKVQKVLVPELGKLFKAMWPLVKPYVMDGLKALFVTSFSPAILKASLSVVTSTLTSAVGGLLKEGIKAAFSGSKGAVAEGVESVASAAGKSSTSAFSKIEGFLGKGMTKALGKVALIAAVTDASIEVGASLRKFPDQLQKEGFDPATSKIAAGSTGIINALTLGLLPDDLQSQIASGLAKIVDVLNGQVEKFFGKQFAESNKKAIAGAFQVFGSLGDVLVALWKGDSAGFDKAGKQLFDGLWDMLVGGVERVVIGIPLILLKVQEALLGAWSFVLDKTGNVLVAMEDVPIVGGLLKYAGVGLKVLAKVPKTLSEIMGELADVVKGTSFSKMGAFFETVFDSISEYAKKTFGKIGDFMSEIWEDTVRPFRQVSEAMTSALEPVTSAVQAFALNFIGLGDSTASFGDVASGVFNEVIDTITSVAEKVYTALRWPIDMYLDRFLSVPKAIRQNMLDILSFFVDLGVKLSAVLMDPHTKGFAKVKEMVGAVFEHLSTLPKLILSMGTRVLDAITSPYVKAFDFIKAFFSVDAFKEIFEGVVEAVSTTLEKLSDSVSEVVSSVFDAVQEKIQDVTTFASDLWDALKVKFVDVVRSILSTVIPVAESIVTAFDAGIGKVKDGLDVFVGYVKDIGDLLLSPFVKVANDITDHFRRGWDATKENMTSVVNFFSDLGTKLLNILVDPHTRGLAKIKELATEAFDHIGKLPNLVSGIFTRTIDVWVTTFRNAFDSIKAIFSVDAFKEIFEGVVEAVSTTLEKLSDSGPFKAVIDVAKAVFKIASPSKEFAQVGDMVAAGFESSVSRIPESASESFDATAEAAMTMSKDVAGSLANATDLKQTDLTARVQDALKTSEEVSSLIVQRTEALVSSIDAATQSMAGIVEAVANGRISDVPLAAADNSIKQYQSVVGIIQRLDDALAGTPAVDINARMASVASRLGLGSSGVYTVRSKEVVIKVNMNVTMDAGEVEKAIVHRSESIIRDRINFALGSGDGKDNPVQQSISETPTPLSKFAPGVT